VLGVFHADACLCSSKDVMPSATAACATTRRPGGGILYALDAGEGGLCDANEGPPCDSGQI
jgi:hypothetical protein